MEPEFQTKKEQNRENERGQQRTDTNERLREEEDLALPNHSSDNQETLEPINKSA